MVLPGPMPGRSRSGSPIARMTAFRGISRELDTDADPTRWPARRRRGLRQIVKGGRRAVQGAYDSKSASNLLEGSANSGLFLFSNPRTSGHYAAHSGRA